jgi:hypothetical protein
VMRPNCPGWPPTSDVNSSLSPVRSAHAGAVVRGDQNHSHSAEPHHASFRFRVMATDLPPTLAFSDPQVDPYGAGRARIQVDGARQSGWPRVRDGPSRTSCGLPALDGGWPRGHGRLFGRVISAQFNLALTERLGNRASASGNTGVPAGPLPDPSTRSSDDMAVDALHRTHIRPTERCVRARARCFY